MLVKCTRLCCGCFDATGKPAFVIKSCDDLETGKSESL